MLFIVPSFRIDDPCFVDWGLPFHLAEVIVYKNE